MNTHSFRIFYCQEWLWGEDQGACSPLTQEEAKKLHDKKMLYAVIIGSFIEKQSKKHDLSCDFYKNKSTFDTRIQQRLVKMGTWI